MEKILKEKVGKRHYFQNSAEQEKVSINLDTRGEGTWIVRNLWENIKYPTQGTHALFIPRNFSIVVEY